MPVSLDMPTLLTSTGIAAAYAMLAMLFVWRVHRREPAVRYWTLCFLLIAVGSTLTGLRSVLPPLVSLVLGNTVIIAGMLVMREGTALFARRGTTNRRVAAGIVVASMAAMTVWGVIVQDYRLRVGAFSLALVAALYLIVRDLQHIARAPRPLIAHALSVLFAIALVATVGRGIAAQFGGPADALFQSSWPQVLWFASAIGVVILSPFGFLLLTSQRLQLRLDRLANEDELTGILNRRAFLARALELLAEQAPDQPAALLAMDLDHFKRLNDQHGHAAGDAVLRGFARAAAAQLRPCDLFARVGGEEFWVLLPDTDAASAERVGERLRAAVESALIQYGTEQLQVTVSVGVAAVSLGDISQALTAADRALYRAKEQGRNRVVRA